MVVLCDCFRYPQSPLLRPPPTVLFRKSWPCYNQHLPLTRCTFGTAQLHMQHICRHSKIVFRAPVRLGSRKAQYPAGPSIHASESARGIIPDLPGLEQIQLCDYPMASEVQLHRDFPRVQAEHQPGLEDISMGYDRRDCNHIVIQPDTLRGMVQAVRYGVEISTWSEIMLSFSSERAPDSRGNNQYRVRRYRYVSFRFS